MSQNRNPFEIRADLIAAAKSYYDQIYAANVEFARITFAELVKHNTVHMSEWTKYVPPAPTMDDILARAQEMYDFISTGSVGKKPTK